MAKHIEDLHQEAVVSWADKCSLPLTGEKVGEHLVHVPNGGKRNAREAARFKKMGVRAGFPDLFLFIPIGGFHGLAIEMKKPIVKGESKPRVTDSQKVWMFRLSAQGYQTAICYGAEQAIKAILNYVNKKPLQGVNG